MRIWLNGALLDDEATVSPLDHGLTTGDGVFETIKVENGRPFAVRRHLERLVRSAVGLGLPAPDVAAIETGIEAVVEPGMQFARLRITYTGGVSPLSSDRGTSGPTILIATQEIERPSATSAIVTVPWVRNERSAVAGLKTTSYAENVSALAYAKERGGSEAIFANTIGNLCEGTGSNVGYVVGGEVRTPSLASGCLAGVTRALLLEWCDVVEVDEPISVLDEAEEVFLVSTTRDVQGVHRVDDRTLEAPGPITRKLQETWAARAAESVDQ